MKLKKNDGNFLYFLLSFYLKKLSINIFHCCYSRSIKKGAEWLLLNIFEDKKYAYQLQMVKSARLSLVRFKTN